MKDFISQISTNLQGTGENQRQFCEGTVLDKDGRATTLHFEASLIKGRKNIFDDTDELNHESDGVGCLMSARGYKCA